jgi:hypothetical protein
MLALQSAYGNRALARAIASGARPFALGTTSDSPIGTLDELQDAGGGIVLGQGDGGTVTLPSVPDSGAAPPASADGGLTPVADPAASPAAGPTEDDGTGPTPAPACTLTYRTDLHAVDGTADDRTTVAIGEVIHLAAGGTPVQWIATGGWPRSRSASTTFDWEMPDPGTATVTATDPATGASCSETFTAILPNAMRNTRISLDAPGASGTAGAGMQQRVHFLPNSVNFHNAEWLEVADTATAGGAGTPEGVSGYFTGAIAAGANLNHAPNPNFLRIRADNTLFDHAAIFGLTAPFSAGQFHWRIPNRFRRAATTGTGREAVTTIQSFFIRADGSARVTKAGANTGWQPVAP